MKWLTRWLGGLLLLALAVRLAAWLLEPAIPLLLVLFMFVFIASLLFHRRL